MRTYNGIPFLVEQHVLRLLKTARRLGLSHHQSAQEIHQAINDALKNNPPGEKLIRIFLTGGDGAGVLQTGKPRLLICVDHFKPFPKIQYSQGVKLMPYTHQRSNPQAKSTNYCDAVTATYLARKSRCDEAVYINEHGHLTEGTTFNILCYTPKSWIIPRDQILFGLTARVVEGYLKRLKQKVIYRDIAPRDLRCAEVYITSSNREIIPVRLIKGMFRAQVRGYTQYSLLQHYYAKAIECYLSARAS